MMNYDDGVQIIGGFLRGRFYGVLSSRGKRERERSEEGDKRKKEIGQGREWIMEERCS